MAEQTNRYIITGGPGSGKSTLVKALANAGHLCFEEISRIIIQEQHAIGGDKVPWHNLKAFAEICFQRMSIQLDKSPSESICFFDRGLPDIIAYMRRGGLNVPEIFFRQCSSYNRTVFIAPPWKEIFVNDQERPESFQESQDIFKFLKSTYTELDYQVIELPKVAVVERVKFIKEHLSVTAW